MTLSWKVLIVKSTLGLCAWQMEESATITEIKIAHRTAYGLMGAGLHGINGVCPGVALKIVNTYVMPRLTFGLKSLVLDKSEIKLLEDLYRRYLR